LYSLSNYKYIPNQIDGGHRSSIIKPVYLSIKVAEIRHQPANKFRYGDLKMQMEEIDPFSKKKWFPVVRAFFSINAKDLHNPKNSRMCVYLR
jgi:hypothetical protein